MKKFATLTESEVLDLAFETLLRKYNEVNALNEDRKKTFGHGSSFYETLCAEYNGKMEELCSEIFRLEKNENN